MQDFSVERLVVPQWLIEEPAAEDVKQCAYAIPPTNLLDFFEAVPETASYP
jgi:hypothetical protein